MNKIGNKVPLPNNSYYPLFPVQETIFDSTTGFPLAAGIVSFFEDQNRTVPKNVYQRTENPDNTFTYDSLGNVLTLSAIGTFVDVSGNNIIPFLWPFEGLPTDNPPSISVQLYYIIVESSGFVPQFTVSAWPPSVVGGSSVGNQIISSQNIVSNPQFAILNYLSPYTFNVTGNSTIEIAPDWNIITTGTGTVTISRISETSLAPGFPAFGLDIVSAGVSLILSQKITMSPRILENGWASGTFVAQAVGSTATIQMNYVPSNPALTIQPITGGTAVLGSYTEFSGPPVDLSLLTPNPDSGAVGFVNVQLSIQANSEVLISCVQLISVPDGDTIPNYIQETTPRQIDHLYHDAYPIVPVGTIIDFAGFNAPLHYFLCNGGEVSRITYNQLYRALTFSIQITPTSTTTFTVTSSNKLGLGMYVEGTGIPFATFITVISGTTITVNQATTATGTETGIFYAWGQGDGSKTFNIPNLIGQVLAGTGAQLVAGNIGLVTDALGQFSVQNLTGSQNLSIANMPAHNHPGSTVALGISSSSVSGPGGLSPVTVGPSALSIAVQGSGTAFSIVQPTTIVYKYIRHK